MKVVALSLVQWTFCIFSRMHVWMWTLQPGMVFLSKQCKRVHNSKSLNTFCLTMTWRDSYFQCINTVYTGNPSLSSPNPALGSVMYGHTSLTPLKFQVPWPPLLSYTGPAKSHPVIFSFSLKYLLIQLHSAPLDVLSLPLCLSVSVCLCVFLCPCLCVCLSLSPCLCLFTLDGLELTF